MERESVTLRQLDEAGQDVRAWCFACGRGERIDSIVWQQFAAKGWPMALDAAAARFRCRQCRSSADVALFPCRRPPSRPMTSADLVAAIFFGARKEAKRRRSL